MVSNSDFECKFHISWNSCSTVAALFVSSLCVLAIQPLIVNLDVDAASWPPEEPRIYPEDDSDHELVLPASPWTYENDSLNPNLHPSNARRRIARSSRRPPTNGHHSALPPYHPDYEESGNAAYSPSSSRDYSSDEDDYYNGGPHSSAGVRVRRGSEGYEVKPVDREEMLRRFVDERTAEPGRYNVYEPEPSSESDLEGDNVPLQHRADDLRASTV